jgi:hypothetical protein
LVCRGAHPRPKPPALASLELGGELEQSLRRGALERPAQPDRIERPCDGCPPAHRPQLLAERGCGALTAAILIGRTAGAARFRSTRTANSGQPMKLRARVQRAGRRGVSG